MCDSIQPAINSSAGACDEADEQTDSCREGTAENKAEHLADLVDDVKPVQVCIRVRPLLRWEQVESLESCALEVQDGSPGAVLLRKEDMAGQLPQDDFGLGPRPRESMSRNFRFDAVFGPESSQQDVWEKLHLSHLVRKVIDGFNAAVFAYGQTGSGKTYTMEGFEYVQHQAVSVAGPSAEARKPRVRTQDTPPEQLGLIPRVVQEVFACIERCRGSAGGHETFSVKVSYLQIYLERIYDLLNPASGASGRWQEPAELKLRWNSAQGRFYVENLFEYECNSVEDVLEHYRRGAHHKTMAATAMNAASSRSHAVLQLSIVRRTEIDGGMADLSSWRSGDKQHHAPIREVHSSLVLVDLAGSERASSTSIDSGTKAGVDRFKEAVNINQSLFALRRVITALSSRVGREDLEHVPYRDSKLTSLLQHVIGGNGFMLMLACLSPADKHYEENLSTLQYASQAALIKAEPLVNLDPKDRLIEALRQQLRKAHDQLNVAQMQLKLAHEYILSHLDLDELPLELDPPAALQLTNAKDGLLGHGLSLHTSNDFRSMGHGPRRSLNKSGRAMTAGPINLQPIGKKEELAEHDSKPLLSASRPLKTITMTTRDFNFEIGSPEDAADHGSTSLPSTTRSLRRSASLPPDTRDVPCPRFFSIAAAEHDFVSSSPSRPPHPPPTPPQLRRTTPSLPAMLTPDRRGSPGQTQQPPGATLSRSRSEQHLPPVAPRGGLPAIPPRRSGSLDATADVHSAAANVRGSSLPAVPSRGGLPLIGPQSAGSADTNSEMYITSSYSRGSSADRAKPRRASATLSPEQQMLRDIHAMRQKQARFAKQREMQAKLESQKQREMQAKLEEERLIQTRLRNCSSVTGREQGWQQPAYEAGEREVEVMPQPGERDPDEPEPGGPGRFEWVQNRCFEMRSRFEQLSPSEVEELEELLDEFAKLVGVG